jgi:hypothetical protein
LVRREIQNKNGYGQERRQPERGLVRVNCREFDDVTGKPAPERGNGAWDEEKRRRSERLLNPRFENKGNRLTGDLGRRAPN